jgi:uncharacterized protein YigA (DUF484 family)
MNQSQDKIMNEQDIIDYLKSNPKFLQKNPDAVDYLLPPKDTANGRRVVDFQHYMVEKLKSDKRMVLDTTRDIIEVSRENMNSLARIHDAVLKVLEAETFDQFIQILSVDVPVALDCDAVSLIVEDTTNRLPTTQMRSLRNVSAGTIHQWMDGNDVRVQSHIKGSEDIFGEAAGLVQSQALLKITQTMPIPMTMIAFGSRDPELFADGQGTDLISFLCNVVERALMIWMR